MKKMTLIALAGFCLALGANAANTARVWGDPGRWWDSHWTYSGGSMPRYNAGELTLDLFGSYTAGQRGIDRIFDTDIQHGDWGGGVGLNYFFTREFGLGADINIPDNDGPFVDHAMAQAILRIPIEPLGLAPYIFGGGGRITDPEYVWAAQAGVGLEFRFNPVTGIFTDARYIWPEEIGDRLVLRAGLRIAF